MRTNLVKYFAQNRVRTLFVAKGFAAKAGNVLRLLIPKKVFKTCLPKSDDAIEFERIIHYYVDFAQFNLAKKALKMSMEQHPQNIELMLLQSEIMLFDGSYNDAQVLLEQIEKLAYTARNH